ncbi:1633_t:CDS:2, partial [Gigaspora rosea]
DENTTDVSIEELSYNKCMKESEDGLQRIMKRILGMLEEIWENPVLSKKFIRSQNKRTYITDIIVFVIRAALKKSG